MSTLRHLSPAIHKKKQFFNLTKNIHCSNNDGSIDYKEFLALSPAELRRPDPDILFSSARKHLIERSYEECKKVPFISFFFSPQVFLG